MGKKLTLQVPRTQARQGAPSSLPVRFQFAEDRRDEHRILGGDLRPARSRTLRYLVWR